MLWEFFLICVISMRKILVTHSKGLLILQYVQDILCCVNLHHMTLFFQLEIKINSVFSFSVRNVNRSTSLPRKQQERNNDNDSQVS